MQLIETTTQTASNILEIGNRKIKAKLKISTKIFNVDWININNYTCFLSDKNSGFCQDCENVVFFIQVPNNAKKIY